MPADISRLRSEVIEKSINIEWLIGAVISQHFFGKVIQQFFFDVLYDEYFSFALKRRILLKIRRDLSGEFENALNRLNTIRNYFAHCGQEFVEGPDPKTGTARVPDPRRTDRSLDFEQLYKEFCELEPKTNERLFAVFKEMGGQAV